MMFNLQETVDIYLRPIFFNFVVQEAEYSTQSRWVLVPGSWLLIKTLAHA